MDRINVLDRGWVELQDVMGNELSVVNAARVSYLGETKGADRDKKLIRYLLENKHTSPFEHVIYRMRIHAPLVVWWQWVRHRTWSFNLQSGRYTVFEPSYYQPSEWRKQSVENHQGSSGVVSQEDAQILNSLLDDYYDMSTEYYFRALRSGVAKEQARLFMPGFAVYYTGVATVDLHNLLHFLSLRMGDHAQYEIREYAQAIYKNIVKETVPTVAEYMEEYYEQYRLD